MRAAILAALMSIVATNSGLAETAGLSFERVPETVRIASFNTDMNRQGAGVLVKDIAGRDQQVLNVAEIILRVRPHVVVSTGALPGLVALIVARMFRARTIWIDSIANTEEMSLSGRLSRPFAGLWLTQWPDVSRKTGAIYAGAVL